MVCHFELKFACFCYKTCIRDDIVILVTPRNSSTVEKMIFKCCIIALSLFKKQKGEATIANIKVINCSRRLEIDLRNVVKSVFVWRMLHASSTLLEIAKEGRKLIVHRYIWAT
jgi:hypothetical protein